MTTPDDAPDARSGRRVWRVVGYSAMAAVSAAFIAVVILVAVALNNYSDMMRDSRDRLITECAAEIHDERGIPLPRATDLCTEAAEDGRRIHGD